MLLFFLPLSQNYKAYEVVRRASLVNMALDHLILHQLIRHLFLKATK